MDEAKEGAWRRRVASGLLLVIVAPAASIVLANLLGFLLPFYVSGLPKEENHDVESALAFQDLAMAWIGLIPVLLTVPLAIGVWRCTPDSALEPPSGASYFRLGLIGLVAVHTVALAARALPRIWSVELSGVELGWTAHVAWWGFVLLGLVYVWRLFGRLGEDRLARRTPLVAAAYVVLVAGNVLQFYVLRNAHPEGTTEDTIWMVASILTGGLIQVVLFFLLASLLWKLRKALLGERGVADETSGF